MRKLSVSVSLVILLAVVLAPASWSQVSFGVKAGLNMADLKNLEGIETADEVKSEGKNGFIGGAYLQFPFGPLKLQVEGLYSMKGAFTRSSRGGADWETQLTYLEVPLLVKLELPTPVLKPFVYGGASAAFLMKAEQRQTSVGGDWIDIKDGLNEIDYGLVVGAGAEFLFLSVDVRYTHGLSEAVDGDGLRDSNSPATNSMVAQAKNRTFSVMAGFRFF